jgi:SanA protein
LITTIIAIPLIWIIIQLKFSNSIFSLSEVEHKKVAIVFGAGLQRDGTPSPILRDRVETAVTLLRERKVQKILFSGDNRFENYNEPGAMQAYALQLGAPLQDIVLDFAGRRTYDTCYRAKFIFKVDEAILVTQKFHLPRALFLCNQIKINAVGVNADLRNYSIRSLQVWTVREIFATATAVWDIFIRKPIPVLGEELPII